MENEYVLHRCVTEFMLDTCRYTKARHCALFECLGRSYLMTIFNDAYELFSSGSSAEFYIKPMLPCIGDTDIMICYKSCLAIPVGHTPPTILPAHFERIVTVYEIIDSHQPGYVYLKLSCILTKSDNCCYESNNLATTVNKRRKVELYASGFLPAGKSDDQNANMLLSEFVKLNARNNTPEGLSSRTHGPAVQVDASMKFLRVVVPQLEIPKVPVAYSHNIMFLNIDFVRCIRCLLWPPQAADWPMRSRDHGWPKQRTIDVVVRSGCDVVGAVHPRCRQDEWMNQHQWRLSFSRAEVTLLNSWTPVQQIIYHMLRFAVKCAVVSKSDDNYGAVPELSNYHIKTLMLWECEQKPESWWSAESSLIKLCSSLLHKLSDWVEDKHCQHYFIGNCNILDHFHDAALTICYDLRRLADSSVLVTWFINRYIRECVQSCPDEVAELFKDIFFIGKLQRVVDAAVAWKLNTLPEALFNEHRASETMILLHIQMYCLDATGIRMYTRELQKFDLSLREYFIAAVSLKVAYKTSIHSLTECLLEMLWALFDPLPTDDSDMVTNRKFLCIKKAIKLATLSNVRSIALEMLHNEMSKAYLHHSFVYVQESTYCVVHVLLAALYYKSEHYQAAIDHCRQVLNQTDHDQYNLQRIGAEYLPQIDESVDTVLGLVSLYHHVQRNVLSSDRYNNGVSSDKKLRADIACVPAFTAQLLAHYIYSKCSTMVNIKQKQMKMYPQRFLRTKEALLSDVLLFKIMILKVDKCTETSVELDKGYHVGQNASRSMDTTLLVKVLELVAIEKLIAVRQTTARELHCEQFPIVNEFEVLYTYKCGLLEECMELCREAIGLLLRTGCVEKQSYCVAFPEMLCLLDDPLVSVYGIIRLLHPNSIFEFCTSWQIHMLTLLLYLLVQCQKDLCSDSLHDTMNLIRHVHNEVFSANSDFFFIDRLVLRVTYRSLMLKR